MADSEELGISGTSFIGAVAKTWSRGTSRNLESSTGPQEVVLDDQFDNTTGWEANGDCGCCGIDWCGAENTNTSGEMVVLNNESNGVGKTSVRKLVNVTDGVSYEATVEVISTTDGGYVTIIDEQGNSLGLENFNEAGTILIPFTPSVPSITVLIHSNRGFGPGDVHVSSVKVGTPDNQGLGYAGVETYRHGYQGQYAEKDTTTGWNAFELRMYDPLIGRWLQVDPEREFASPYNGMGNNPLGLTDPTGGMTCCLSNPLSKLAARVANWWNNSTRVIYSSVELKGGVALAGAGEMTISGNAYDRHGQIFFEASPSLGDSRTDFALGGGVGIELGAFIVPNSNFMDALNEMSLTIEATAVDVMFIGEGSVRGFGANLGFSADLGFSSFGLGNDFSFIAFLDNELSITPMSGTWEARNLDGSFFLFMDDGFGNFENTNIQLQQYGSGFMTEGFYEKFNKN